MNSLLYSPIFKSLLIQLFFSEMHLLYLTTSSNEYFLTTLIVRTFYTSIQVNHSSVAEYNLLKKLLGKLTEIIFIISKKNEVSNSHNKEESRRDNKTTKLLLLFAISNRVKVYSNIHTSYITSHQLIIKYYSSNNCLLIICTFIYIFHCLKIELFFHTLCFPCYSVTIR